MKVRTRAMPRIRSRAKLLDEPGRPDDGFENRLQERAVPAYAIDVGGDADKFALSIEFDVAAITPVDRSVHVQDRRHQTVHINAFGIPDDVVLGLLGQTGPEKRERLGGAVANPDAVVVAGAGFEGGLRRIDEDQRRLRLERVADLLVADRDPSRPELFAPSPDDVVANGAESPVRVRRDAVPHRGRHDERDGFSRREGNGELAGGAEEA